ncbi:MAG: TPM domain-containing protein [Alphaproteobacteria bacterium]|nr:TPM domain-containing protein [Alphaproteobacteria bacterium]
MKVFLISIFFIFFMSYPAQATIFPEKPTEQNFVVDQAHVIKEADRKEINTIAEELFRDKKVPMFVVTISSLAAYEASGLGIEPYAKQLFNSWGIGPSKQSHGILLFISVGEQKVRIELGEGFGEEYNKQAEDIMQSLILPAFKQENLSIGTVEGVRGLNALARGIQIPKHPQPAWVLPVLVGGGIFLIALIFSLFKNGKAGWAWSLIAIIGVILFIAFNTKSSGGRFGGGKSGGGGSTGSW